MCLFDKRKFRFTFWRKKCYKVLTTTSFAIQENRYCTPYRNTLVIISDTGKTVLVPENPSAEPTKYDFTAEYIFEEGFIFCFDSLEKAKEMTECLYHAHIFEGYIPAFTRYAEDYDESCARKVVLTKRIF